MVRPLLVVLFTAALLSLSSLCRGALAAEPEVINGIAAVVRSNDTTDVITYSEVRALSAPKEKLLHEQYRGEELITKIKEARAAALKDLIDRQLIIQAFKKEGFQIPDHFLDQRVQDMILGKLVNGAEFERMAQIYSEDSTRDLGGDWGWVDRGTLTAPLEKVAFNLRPGKVSNIIQLGGNYYILKVEDKRGGVTRSFAEVRDEIEKKLVAEEAQAKQERWLTSLRQKAYIKMY